MPAWTAADLPDQTGRSAVVTGANSGIGFHVARHLAGAGARVVLACRNTDKGQAAAARIRAEHPDADLRVVPLDLADLDSVRAFAERLREELDGLDLLLNNAGVMAPPRREVTRQGFELQLGTNHLGHYALTALLLPALARRPGARVVTVSSLTHRQGRIDFEDLNSERRYSPWGAYAQSKLANLLFTAELDRRLRARGLDLLVVAAHPGIAATNLVANGPGAVRPRLVARLMTATNNLIAQTGEAGALPVLYAATSPDVEAGGYYGPSGFRETRGAPARVRPSARAQDAGTAGRLWAVSAELTGVAFADLA